jgi:hypothetical protein
MDLYFYTTYCMYPLYCIGIHIHYGKVGSSSVHTTGGLAAVLYTLREGWQQYCTHYGKVGSSTVHTTGGFAAVLYTLREGWQQYCTFVPNNEMRNVVLYIVYTCRRRFYRAFFFKSNNFDASVW